MFRLLPVRTVFASLTKPTRYIPGGRFFMKMSDKAGIMLTFTRIKFLADGVTVTISSSYGASSDQQEYDLICADGRWIVRGVRTISGS
jgi:hypothetical protein